MKYDEHYFTSVNYTNYLERKDRFEKLAKEMLLYFLNKQILRGNSKILDYGCSVGFLVESIRKFGFECEGYDISEWAEQECLKKHIFYIPYKKRNFDLMFALDVFEHMTDEDIKTSITLFSPKYLIVRIPCSTDGGHSFHLKISNNDPTHINCKTSDSWIEFFSALDYNQFDVLDLYTIYDTKGVMCRVFIKT